MAEQVGGLYVTVGVDAKKAILEAKELNEKLYAISRTIAGLNKSTNLDGLTRQLKKANAEATKTKASLASAGTGGGSKANAEALKLLEQQQKQMNDLRALDNKAQIEAAAAQAVARQKAAQAAAAEQKRLAQLTMQQLEKEIAATAAAAEAQVKAAQREVAAATKATAEIGAAHRALTKEIQADYDRQARAAEKAAARETRAAAAAASSRRGALKRGGADFASAGAAAVSGNAGYALANVAQGVIKMSGAITGASKAAMGLSLGFGAIAAAGLAVEAVIAGVTIKVAEFGIKTAASFETLQIQLEGLLGSAKKGKEEMDFLLNLGQTSIVPTESLIAASRQLAAFGVENTKQRRDLVQFISDFGTATSATEQQIYFLALAVGQVAARGKADMVDLKQLGNAGIKTIDIYKAVGKEIGKPWEEVRDGVKDGIITADLLIAALASLDEKYQGTAKKAMKSTNGLLANIKDVVTVGMGRAFESLNKQVGAVLQDVIDALKKVDFSQIAIAIQNVISNINTALGGVPDAGDATVTFFNKTLPDAIRFVGNDIATLVKDIRVAFLAVQTAGLAVEVAFHGIAAAIVTIAIAVYDSVNAMTLGLGGLVDSATLKIRDTLVSAQQDAAAAGNAAIDQLIIKNDELNALWATPVNKELTYSISYAGAYGPGGSVYNSQLGPYVLDAMKPKPEKPPKIDPVGGSSGSSGAAKVNPMIQKLKDLVSAIKELVTQSMRGRDSLREMFQVPFASKVVQGGGQAITAANKAFASGDVDTIVSQYKEARQALEDFYAVGVQRGSKANRKAMLAQRKEDVAFLKRQTGELVRLATARAQMEQQLADAEEAYNKQVDAIQKNRDAQQKQYDAQQKAIARQYDDYYTATSATTGTFTKGAINVAQDALDAATDAYDKAKEKLDELTAARDEFLSSLKEMAYNFVNDLSKVNEEITRFTRLDAIGSFSSVTENVASTKSFTQGLKDRLAALKDFAANVATLTSAGLDKGLLQQILLGGPEESGALAKSLAGASASEIADINAIQADLASTVSGMQRESSAAWFDAGIAAQEAFTSPLKAAMDAAQKQVDSLNQQKDLALGILEAWNTDQTAMYDAQEEAAAAHYQEIQDNMVAAMKLNQQRMQQLADQIDERMKVLPDNAYAQGLAVIDGLIKGLGDSDKLKELKAAARAMAQEIKRSVNETLGISSPSRVMIESGYNVGLGLAAGMGLSEPLVADSASSLARAAIGTLGGDGAALSGGDTLVKVFIGERELTDIVDYQIERADATSGSFVMTGRRL
jgi:hypothetical protein